jgi:HlyD family secretion protein
MDKKLFPPEIIDFSVEKLIHDYSQRSNIIYNTVLVAVVCCLVVLCYIRVDVSVGSSGTLRPLKERIVITAPVDGRIVRFLVVENQDVKQGDTLLILEDTQYQSQMQNLLAREIELDDLLNDLQILTQKNRAVQKLKTLFYRQSYSSYLYDLSERNTKLKLLRKRHSRDEALYKSNTIAAAEYELTESEYNAALINLKLFKNKQADQWQYEALTYRNELRDISAKIEQLNNQSERLILVSPCDGNIQQKSGLQENMFVLASQPVVEISPDSELIAECYVAPKDIGFIREGMEVRLQMQAYNYNDWGVVKGKVLDISKDIFLNQGSEGQESFFKVKCTLDTLLMHLKNGYEVELQKGLTFNARFVVTRRTIFQLLYDKVDNWLNPATSEKIQ